MDEADKNVLTFYKHLTTHSGLFHIFTRREESQCGSFAFHLLQIRDGGGKPSALILNTSLQSSWFQLGAN